MDGFNWFDDCREDEFVSDLSVSSFVFTASRSLKEITSETFVNGKREVWKLVWKV